MGPGKNVKKNPMTHVGHGFLREPNLHRSEHLKIATLYPLFIDIVPKDTAAAPWRVRGSSARFIGNKRSAGDSYRGRPAVLRGLLYPL